MLIKLKMKVAIQGVRGAFHEVAAREFFKDNEIDVVEKITFNDVLDALLFLKVTDFPEDEVMPLFRDSTEEEKQLVRERFGYC